MSQTSKNTNIIFLSIVLIELIILPIPLKQIERQKRSVLGTVIVNPISRDSIKSNDEVQSGDFYEPDPNRIIEDKPDWLEYIAKYIINSDSLNERFDYSPQKPPNTYRIISLGDSYTFGEYVNTKDNYPEQLEDLLNSELKCAQYNNFEVINLGFWGYDIQYSVNRYKTRGIKYNTDLILWFLKTDDFFNINSLFMSESFWKRVKQIEEEARKNGEFNRYYQEGDYHFAYNKAWQEKFEKINMDSIFKKQKEFFADFYQNYQNKLILITYKDEQAKVKNALNELVSSHKNTYLFENIYYKELDRLPDLHPSSLGYRKLARKIFDFIKGEQLIPCKKISNR